MSKTGNFIISSKDTEPVMLCIGHAGINPEAIINVIQTEEFQTKLQNRPKKNRIIISSNDQLSNYSGIRAKLIAYYKFLKQTATNQRE